MATLPINLIDRSGLDLDAADQAAAGGGDDFPNDGETSFYVNNAGGTTCNVTVALANDPNASDPIQSTAAVPAPVLTTEKVMLGPYPVARYGSSVSVAYDQVVTVTVAAVRMPKS